MRPNPIRCVCPVCGAAFRRTVGQIAWGMGKHCSQRCYDIHRGAAPTLVRSCRVCGTTIRVKASDADKRGAYCSRSCYDARPKLGETRKCLICGKEFYAYPKDIKRGRARCCSAACSAAARRNATPHSRARWRYFQWREAVFLRDNHTCTRCGIPGGHLHAHHVELWSRRPDLRFDVANGLTLHAECHRLLHIEQGTWSFQ